MKKFFKIFAIVIIFTLIIMIIVMGKNFLRLKEIEEKFSKYRNPNNYSYELKSQGEVNGKTNLRDIVSKIYYKDGIRKDVVEQRDGRILTIQLTTKDSRISIIDSNDVKRYNKYDEQNEVIGEIYNTLETTSFSEKIHNILTLKIERVEEDGEKLYKITGMPASEYKSNVETDNEEIYLSYETGVLVKIVRYYNYQEPIKETIYTKYEFGNVTDEDLLIPTEEEWLR